MLETIAITAPHLEAANVLGTGASDMHHIFSGADLDAVINAYMVGIKNVFGCSLAGSALTVLISLLIPLTELPNHSKKEEVEVHTTA